MTGEDLSDDYVAQLLAKDAKERSIKYSAMGLDAFLPTKSPANKPKPNTRFLRNLMKETDNHNAALLAKEAAESKARLNNMEKKSARSSPDIRQRQLGLIAAHLSEQPRRAKSTAENASKRRRHGTPSDEDRDHRDSAKRRRRESSSGRYRDRNGEENRSKHRSHKDHSEKNDRYRSRRSRSRTRSPIGEESRHRHRSHRRRKSESPSRSRSKERSRGHQHERRERRQRHQSRKEEAEPSRRKQTARSPRHHQTTAAEDSSSSSDPLDSIIGPRPPPTAKIRTKGRGRHSSISGIDSRFSAGYDPSADVALNEDEEDDWDMALEALRDRQKWKAQGADRLRAAGFTNEEVSKWESSGGAGAEKSEADVKWAKRGETKEWDRGKVAGGVFGTSLEEDAPIVVRKRTPDVDMGFGRLTADW